MSLSTLLKTLPGRLSAVRLPCAGMSPRSMFTALRRDPEGPSPETTAPGTSSPVAAAKSGRRRLVLAAIALTLAVAVSVGTFNRDIDAPTAAGMADRLLAQYSKGSGEPFHNFGRREDKIWADGWEFRWRYAPCPQFASLRVWISRDGRRASYAEMPDCNPDRGIMVTPLKT